MQKDCYYSGKSGQLYGPHIFSGAHYVYAHVNSQTKEIFYIGLGRGNRCNQILKRNQYWKNYTNKHKFFVSILKQNITRIEAAKLEKMLILQLKPKCNLTLGGESRKATGIRVFAFYKNGDFYKGFRSISDANIFLGVMPNDSRIVRCLAKKRKRFKGFMWSSDRKKIPVYEPRKSQKAKTVHEYGLDGKWKASYESPSCAKVPTRTGIYTALDKANTYFGSFWRTYKVDRLGESPPSPSLIPSRKVICLKSGRIFDSVSKAASFINMNHQTLSKKLRGHLRNNTNLRFYEQVPNS